MKIRNLEGLICPWIGCGGTIRKTGLGNSSFGVSWSCEICAEHFKSLEEYNQKVQKEDEWAMGWVESSNKKDEPMQSMIDDTGAEDESSLVEVEEA